MGKIPYMPLYIGDWEQDTNCLSIEAEGSWLKVVFKCWKNKGIYLSDLPSLARLCRVSDEKFATILLEWKKHDICNIEEREDGAILIVCRRHIKDIEKSKKKAISGSKGGSKTQAKLKQKEKITQAKNEQIPEYDIDNESEVDNENKKEGEEKFVSREPLTKNELFDAIFNDQKYIEGLSLAHRGKDIEQAWAECWLHHSEKPSPPQELWEWKQKLNTWLTIKGEKKHSNGTSKTKHQQQVDSLVEDYAKQYGPKPGG